MAGNNFIVGHEYEVDADGTKAVWGGKKGWVAPDAYLEMKGKGQKAFDDNVEMLKRLQKARELSGKWDATGFLGRMEAGTAGGIYKGIGGTAGYDLDRTLLPVRARNMIANLQEMRNNSPTGGAVGNVSDTEGAKLESTDASLDVGQSREQLQREIDTQRDAYSRKVPGLTVDNPIDLKEVSPAEVPQGAYFRHPDGRVFQNRRNVPVPPRGAPGLPAISGGRPAASGGFKYLGPEKP